MAAAAISVTAATSSHDARGAVDALRLCQATAAVADTATKR
jgi:hypothetical protein